MCMHLVRLIYLECLNRTVFLWLWYFHLGSFLMWGFGEEGYLSGLWDLYSAISGAYYAKPQYLHMRGISNSDLVCKKEILL